MRINGNEGTLSHLLGRKADAAADAQSGVPAKAAKTEKSEAASKVDAAVGADAATAAVAAQNARAAVSVAVRTGRQVASVVARSTFDLRV